MEASVDYALRELAKLYLKVRLLEDENAALKEKVELQSSKLESSPSES